MLRLREVGVGMQKLWKPEVISMRPGTGNWIEVKAPWDLPEGSQSLMGTRLVHEDQEREVHAWQTDQTAPIAKGEPVKINLKPRK